MLRFSCRKCKPPRKVTTFFHSVLNFKIDAFAGKYWKTPHEKFKIHEIEINETVKYLEQYNNSSENHNLSFGKHCPKTALLNRYSKKF